MAILLPMFLRQGINAKDARAKSYLTLAWQALTVASTADESGFSTASTLAGELQYDEPELKAQVVTDCSTATMAAFDDKTLAIVGPQTNSAAMVVCVRSTSGNIYELIASSDGSDPTIVLLSQLTGKPPVNLVAPSVIGDVRTGQRVTAAEGGWESPTPPSYTYQWEQCAADGSGCAPIGGATSTTYLVNAGDFGHTLEVQVTATNPYGSATATSRPTGSSNTNLAGLPDNTSLPQIAGAAAQGQTLTADKGIWTGTPTITYSYQWQRSTDNGVTWNDISGQTNTTYNVLAADVGDRLRVEVIATNAEGEQDAYSAQTSQVIPPPVNTGLPVISGTAQDSQVLSTSNGTWTASPTGYSYQWQYSSNGGSTWAAINGATNSTYTIPYGTYTGDKLRAQVTATNAAGSSTATSAATSAVLASPPVNTAIPTVSGTAQDGQTLTATSGTWNGTPTITYAYQWQYSPNGSTWTNEPSGGTASTYNVQPSDVGNVLRVSVTATNGGGSTLASSAATATVVSTVPVGAIVPYVGSTVPSGWLLADGHSEAQSSYPQLYALIGANGGTGSYFNTPDMNGRVPLGRTASGTGSGVMRTTDGQLVDTGTVSIGSIPYSFGWTDTLPASFSFYSHTFTTPGGTFGFYRYTSSGTEDTDCTCSSGHSGVSVGAGSEVATLTSANPTGTATGTANVTASYTSTAIPYLTVRYIVKAVPTAADPVCAIWPSAASSLSGTVLADGSAASGNIASCLDSAYGGSLPSLTGRYPVGQTASGTGSTLNASGGAFNQTASVSLNTASTQATVSLQAPLSASISVTDGAHGVSLSGSIGYWEAGTAVATSVSGATDNNPGRTSSTTVSPTFGGGTGLSNAVAPESATSSTWHAPFVAVGYRMYTASNYSLQPGTMMAWTGTSPSGSWLKADGSCYSTATYAALFSAISYTYGGSGGTFCVPNMTGASAIGSDSSNASISSVGKTGGALDASPGATLASWTPSLTVDSHSFIWSVADNSFKLTFNNAPNGAQTGGSGGIQGNLVKGGTWTTAMSNGGNPLTATQTVAQQTAFSSAVGAQGVTLPNQNPPLQTVVYLIHT